MTNTTDLHIRRATIQDSRVIAEIGVAGWQAAYRAILPGEFLASLSVDAREVAWRMRLASEEGDSAPSWIAARHGRAIAYLSSGPPRDEDVTPPAAEVYAIYVLPDAWRSGAGRALMAAALDRWGADPATTMVLWVLEANSPARQFYQAMGWRPDGARQLIELGGVKVREVRYRLIAERP
jgi:GNAT superfamily N-acetyltransferase